MIDEMYAKGEAAHLTARDTAARWFLKEWGFFWNEEQAKNLDL